MLGRIWRWLSAKIPGPGSFVALILSAIGLALDSTDLLGLGVAWRVWTFIFLGVAFVLFSVTYLDFHRRVTPRIRVRAITRGAEVNGAWLEYACLEVTNDGERVKGCTGYLHSVEIETEHHGPQPEADKHPTYLQWSSKDGGGKILDFDTHAALDVAEFGSSVYPLVVYDHAQRDQYRLVAGFSYLLDIEVSSENAGRKRGKYRISVKAGGEDPSFDEVLA